MEKIIYKMTDDLFENFHTVFINEAAATKYVIENLAESDYLKLNIDNIINEINSFYAEKLAQRDDNLARIDELLHFYYPELLSYEILYEEESGLPTGEVIVCIP